MNAMIVRERERGFTLVELSIVLVIIGLLIGGILVAQSMIGTSKIQAQVRQFQQFDILTTNFKTKFNQLPGDCSSCPYTLSPIHGDGNSKINDYNDVTPPVHIFAEPYYYFINLYQMGFISDVYQLANGQYDFGINNQFPKASIGRGGVIVTGNNSGNIYYTFMYSNGSNGFYSNAMSQGNLSSTEALALDTKLDDGIPTSGDTQATSATAAASTATIPFTAETDSSSTCVYNSKYNTDLPATNLCRLVVKSNFQ